MNRNARKEIERIISGMEDSGELEEVGRTGNDISAFHRPSGKSVTWHLARPTRNRLNAKLEILPDAAKTNLVDRETILDLLLSLDPAMLATLEKIHIFTHEDGCAALAEAVGRDPEEVPDAVGEGGAGCVGCLWHDENSVIIDLTAISRLSEEAVAEDRAAGICWTDIRDHAEPGIMVTLAHEIRHLAMANPLVADFMAAWNPDFDRDAFGEDFEWLSSEDGVEEWAREAYEKFKEGGDGPKL